MARSSRLTEHDVSHEPPQEATAQSPAVPAAAAHGEPGGEGHRPAAARKPKEPRSPSELWGDGLGRVGIRAAQVLLILIVRVDT